ncbi:hypothetical protein [Glaciecola petra]|uniref:Uncharacterized protein n=1 Tax=Glaciecola petra TaxID=3075602 RepID=A0ABU2ZP68_9ALTE|nr:hypothetical protein [Aestuariibacter sp. P117]MDT0594418.1 hypothetical protein [Aestuariibacter sp. P117]
MKERLFKYATIGVVCLLILRPDTIMLALFLDAIGLELFVLFLGMQFRQIRTFIQFHIQSALSCVALKTKFQRSFFFIPKFSELIRMPSMLCHAIPGFGGFYSIIWLIRTNTRVQQKN